jgi:CBS domain containing-hemolysin-like protein
VLLRIACEVTATALLVAFLEDFWGLDWGLLAAAAIMVVVSFVAIGVGPRTIGRQNAYTIALGAAVPLQAISILLTPISRLLILLGNALTPGRDSATARSPRRSNCARWSTWRSRAGWWPTTSAG